MLAEGVFLWKIDPPPPGKHPKFRVESDPPFSFVPSKGPIKNNLGAQGLVIFRSGSAPYLSLSDAPAFIICGLPVHFFCGIAEFAHYFELI